MPAQQTSCASSTNSWKNKGCVCTDFCYSRFSTLRSRCSWIFQLLSATTPLSIFSLACCVGLLRATFVPAEVGKAAEASEADGWTDDITAAFGTPTAAACQTNSWSSWCYKQLLFMISSGQLIALTIWKYLEYLEMLNFISQETRITRSFDCKGSIPSENFSIGALGISWTRGASCSLDLALGVGSFGIASEMRQGTNPCESTWSQVIWISSHLHSVRYSLTYSIRYSKMF